MDDIKSLKLKRVTYCRASVEQSLSCRGCTQSTRRAIVCKDERSPQHIITPFCDQCFDIIKRLPSRQIDIEIVSGN